MPCPTPSSCQIWKSLITDMELEKRKPSPVPFLLLVAIALALAVLSAIVLVPYVAEKL